MSTTAAANGGHFKHASNANTGGAVLACSYCHAGYTATVANGATHANKTVELNAIGYSKGTVMSAGTAWGTCSATQCHGQATGIAWNSGSLYFDGTDHCSTCHSSPTGVTAGTPFYSTKYPGGKQVATNDSKVGAHTYHVTNISLMTNKLVCADCHGTVALKDPNHMNGTTNFVWGAGATINGTVPSYNAVSGTCAVYCHGSNMPDYSGKPGSGDTSGINRTPTWKAPFMPPTLTLPDSCNSCHGFPPAGPNHPTTGTTLAACAVCHPNVNGGATTYAGVFKDITLHINGKIEGGGCNGCHGYPPVRKGFVGSAGNYADAVVENYTSAGGAHTIIAHVDPNALQTQGWVNCVKCHNQNDHNPSSNGGVPAPSNVKVSIDSKYKFNKDRVQKYENDLNNTNHVAGSCANIACHFQKTPKW
jgi:hypothetical protein